MGRAAAIAEVIRFLASDASRAVKGEAIPVFGKGEFKPAKRAHINRPILT
jgi:hypothetical protein